MFRITEDPSSGRLVQYLSKNYKNYSIVSVDMDKVGVMDAYSDPLCVCVHTHNGSEYAYICTKLNFSKQLGAIKYNISTHLSS